MRIFLNDAKYFLLYKKNYFGGNFTRDTCTSFKDRWFCVVLYSAFTIAHSEYLQKRYKT